MRKARVRSVIRMVERVTLAAATHMSGVASAAVAPALTGPVLEGRVLAAFPAAVHIGTGSAELPLVCLATPAAVRLPCAVVVLRLPAARPDEAALLRHAAQGECIPELAELLAALDGRADLPSAVRRLGAVGDSSGSALTAGVRLALCGLAA